MTDGTSPILEIEHVTIAFGGVVAIDDLSFTAQRGDITSIIGPNGAGKTTLFNCLTGFYAPPVGRMRFIRSDGRSFLLERLDAVHIAKEAKIVRTFQNVRLFSSMSVLENLLVAQHEALKRAWPLPVLRLFAAARERRAMAEAIQLARYWLERMELAAYADEPAGTLPYGLQRRLEIARALCARPELLCLDEPAAGLDPFETHALKLLLADLRDQHGLSILLVEHDMSVVMQLSNSIVVLDHGALVRQGTPSEVRNDPDVIRVYLGEAHEEALNRRARAS